MSNFFVGQQTYDKRIEICKGCAYYFKPSGQCKRCLCFMKIKARIGSQSCPQKYWDKTSEVEVSKDIPKEIIEEVLDLWKDLKTGRAKDQAAKKKMIELYNTISGSNYNTRTNCGSCIAACFDGIKKIYKEHSS